jgi:hypothetical protein
MLTKLNNLLNTILNLVSQSIIEEGNKTQKSQNDNLQKTMNYWLNTQNSLEELILLAAKENKEHSMNNASETISMITELPNVIMDLLTKLIKKGENNTSILHNERFREISNQWNDTKKSLSHIEKVLSPTKSISSMNNSILALNELRKSSKKDNEILWFNNERKINELSTQINTSLENLMELITQLIMEERKNTLKIQNERFKVVNNQYEKANKSLTLIRDSLIPIEQIPSMKDSIHILTKQSEILDRNIQSNNEELITNLNMIPNTIMTLFTQVIDGKANIKRNE